METKEMKTTTTTSADDTRYPGVAVDEADDNKVSQKAVDDYTKELNCNPRTDGE